jgi:enoyl-CoA hydratase/carnithine racemase
MPGEICQAVELANDQPDVQVIILRSTGAAFCACYDLKLYAEAGDHNRFIQGEVWEPI